MAPILIILPGAVVVDVIDHVIRVGPFEWGVACATPLRTMAAVEVT